MNTCLKSHFKSFLCQLSLLHSIENKQVEVYCEIMLSRIDCKSKLDQQCTRKCSRIFNLNKKYVARSLKHKQCVQLLAVKIMENKMFYLAINSSESDSESESESSSSSAFMNLDICVFFILYLHSSK